MAEITWFIKHKRYLSFIMIILLIISMLSSNLLSISIQAAYTHHYYYEDYMFHNSDNTGPDTPICTNLIKILAFVTCPFFVFQQKNPQNTQERHPQKEG